MQEFELKYNNFGNWEIINVLVVDWFNWSEEHFKKQLNFEFYELQTI